MKKNFESDFDCDFSCGSIVFSNRKVNYSMSLHNFFFGHDKEAEK